MEEEKVYQTKQDKILIEGMILKTPMGAKRTTHQGRFSERAQKYHNWMTTVRWEWVQNMMRQGLSPQYKIPGVIESLTFGIPIPNPEKAGSKQKKQERLNRITQPHDQRPDLDNLVKAFLDAIAYKQGWDDSHVHTFKNVSKVWAPYGEGYILYSFYYEP